MEERVILSKNLRNELATAISECEHDRLFILTDETTQQDCFPVVKDFFCLKNASPITIQPSDTHKDLDAVTQVWKALCDRGASRHSLLINLGGGMVTDLGGFAASTFKRGIDFINIPTTLLSMVDASVGGKTGINFNGLKNEIGVFNEARFVIIDPAFLRTLDQENILSGYAEMLKHSLIADEKMWAEHVCFDLKALAEEKNADSLEVLKAMIAKSISVKERVVTEDPHERGLRKALNLGHTFGHAFESHAMHQGKPVLHGYAVAFGLICELYLSAIKTSFPTDKMRKTVNFIQENYGHMPITCNDYPTLIELMMHDKKNMGGIINFTLLGNVGDIRINQNATVNEIKEALDFYREG